MRYATFIAFMLMSLGAQAQKPPGTNMSGYVDVGIVVAVILSVYFLTRWFSTPPKPKKKEPEKPKPEWYETVASKIGNWQQIAPNTKIAGFKIEDKRDPSKNPERDVDTFIFMAKVDKSSVRADEHKKVVAAEEAAKRLRKFNMWLSILLFLMAAFLVYWIWFRSGR